MKKDDMYERLASLIVAIFIVTMPAIFGASWALVWHIGIRILLSLFMIVEVGLLSLYIYKGYRRTDGDENE